jgi:hypothetical protein
MNTAAKDSKCNQKNCLNNDKGVCDLFVPTMLSERKLGSVACKYYEDNFEETYKKVKEHGGVIGMLRVMEGKEAIKEIEKKPRKPRADKGQPRKKKEKKKK